MKYIVCFILVLTILLCGCTTQNQTITAIKVKDLDNSNVVQCGYSSATVYYVTDSDNNLYIMGTPCDTISNMGESYKAFKYLKVNQTYMISYYHNMYGNIITGIEAK